MNAARTIAFGLAAISVVACLPQNDSSTPAPPSSFIEDYPDQNQRVALSTETPLDWSVLRDANHAMTQEVYLAIHDDNFVVSPYEITQNITQLALASKGATRNELLQSIGISPDNESFPEQANEWDQQLLSGKSDLSRYSLLLGQVKYPYLTSFLDSIASYFGATMEGIDFLASDASARIRHAVNAAAPDAASLYTGFTNRSRLGVGNGMKQPASGYDGLASEALSEIRFGYSGSEVIVPGIKLTGTMAYTENDDYQAFDLPLGQGAVSLTIIMPKDDRYTAVESQINQQLFANVIAALQPAAQTVYLPAFRFTSTTSVRTFLADLDYSGAHIEGVANFSGVNGAGYLFLDGVDQQTSIALGVQGVELSAHVLSELEATHDEPPSYWNGSVYGVIARADSGWSCSNDIDARSRPFIFLLRDTATDTWLAVGRVTRREGVRYDPCSYWFPVEPTPAATSAPSPEG